ncbi:MAG: type II secretion system F family protein [Parcubacteria group bacterium]
MLYKYQGLENTGAKKEGTIEAVTMDVAIDALQKRGLIITEIKPAETKPWYEKEFGGSVKNKDIVILSRQLATLFNAQVSALKVFTMLGTEVENKILREALSEIASDLQGGSSISTALSKHPKIFSDFYINMVKAGEETGKLNQTFEFLADYLERNYEVVSKAKNALIYPAFVIGVFIAVMILIFTVIIPKISIILIESGQPIPFYTQVVFSISNFLLDFGAILAAAIVIGIFMLVRYVRSDEGKHSLARFKISVPYIGDLYRKLYLSVIADNMNTMVASSIPMVRALEITAAVVGNDVYKRILLESVDAVRAGSPLSQSLSNREEIPGIFVQMIKVGEETGELGNILKTMAHFYQREVMNAVDTLVDLIEPVMIVSLGLGVGVVMASVLIPIYSIANAA